MFNPFGTSNSVAKHFTFAPGLRKATDREKVEIQSYCHQLDVPIEKVDFGPSAVLHQTEDLKACIVPYYGYYDLVRANRTHAKLIKQPDIQKLDEEKHYIPVLHKGVKGKFFQALHAKEINYSFWKRKEQFEALKTNRKDTKGFNFSKYLQVPNKPHLILELLTTRPEPSFIEQWDLPEAITPLLSDFD